MLPGMLIGISNLNQIIIQGLGFLALLFVILSFQKKERTRLLAIMLAGLLLFVVHFSLLHAWTGALMNLIEAGVVFVSYKSETAAWAKKSFWPYFFIALYIIFGFLIYKNPSDLLPIIAQSFGAIATWQKNQRALRFIMLLPRPLWFIYNFIVGSYAGMVTEVLILISVIVGIVRFDILYRVDNKN
ncbi:MAG: YgjV family protein [Candidatus Magasanikbacteria bacterium]|nr:YgjV family protein [Candidatus Magasanikbacteria bacterium]